MPNVKGRYERRSRKRLARVRLNDPKALPRVDASDGINRREARRIKGAARAIPAKPKPVNQQRVSERYDSMATTPRVNPNNGFNRKEAKRVNSAYVKAGRPQPFRPEAPLTGRSFADETAAAQRLKFGPAEQELGRATAAQTQTTANTAQYYDDYRQALREATDRIAGTNTAAVAAAEGRVDQAHQQDVSAGQARDAEDARQAQLLGRPAPQTSVEGQAADNRRALGNTVTAAMRDRGASDASLMEKRGATSVLQKAEALGRQNSRMAELDKQKKQLAQDKGDFAVKARTDARQSEREWSAIQKEFGLKKQELKQDAKSSASDRKLEQQKLNAQKIVARIYASADKAGARAQIRVAKLQLEKGKISQHQYRTIVNEYRGLPEKGQSPGAKPKNGAAPKAGTPKGSGPGGSLAPWERDKLDLARKSLGKAHPTPDEKQVMIGKLVDAGIPARLARAAWARYIKNYRSTATGPQGLPTANGRQ